ncbi:STAS domain-containing protein [Sorangium sp. So ce296]|uniref:STAS domain-containing protein n=1 Tax=Sorangium sp. So ce296 TaxID=3133296 RepID=UPI003F6008FA
MSLALTLQVFIAFLRSNKPVLPSNSPATESIRSFFASCPEMLFVAKLDGELLHCTDSLRQAVGLAPDQETSLLALAHSEERDAVEATLARLRSGGDPVQLDVRVQDGRGAYAPMSYSLRRSPEGDAIHGSLRRVAGGTTDGASTARMKAKLLDCIADQMDIGVWAVDPQGTFIYHDGKGIEQAGVKRGALLGMDVFQVYAGTEIAENLKQALTGKQMHAYNSAHDMHWESWFSPVFDADGAIQMVAGLTLNITELRRAEDDVRNKLMQIQRQQEVIRNLSTPIIEVWDGVLTLPLVGVVDSMRTADVLDALLTRIVDKQARYAILDLTGVDIVDSSVASNLIQLVTAIRLLGAEGVVAGIKPNVAMTMVQLGLDLSQIPTQRNLRAALAFCIGMMNGEQQKQAHAQKP